MSDIEKSYDFLGYIQYTIMITYMQKPPQTCTFPPKKLQWTSIKKNYYKLWRFWKIASIVFFIWITKQDFLACWVNTDLIL